MTEPQNQNQGDKDGSQQDQNIQDTIQNSDLHGDTISVDMGKSELFTNDKTPPKPNINIKSESNTLPEIGDLTKYIQEKKLEHQVKQSSSIKLVSSDGTNLKELENIYAVVPHAKGDHKLVYFHDVAPEGLLDDEKGRIKGEKYIKRGIVIYDVFVDFKQHPTLLSNDEENIDVWLILNHQELEDQLHSIHNGRGGGGNFRPPVIIDPKQADKVLEPTTQDSTGVEEPINDNTDTHPSMEADLETAPVSTVSDTENTTPEDTQERKEAIDLQESTSEESIEQIDLSDEVEQEQSVSPESSDTSLTEISDKPTNNDDPSEETPQEAISGENTEENSDEDAPPEITDTMGETLTEQLTDSRVDQPSHEAESKEESEGKDTPSGSEITLPVSPDTEEEVHDDVDSGEPITVDDASIDDTTSTKKREEEEHDTKSDTNELSSEVETEETITPLENTIVEAEPQNQVDDNAELGISDENTEEKEEDLGSKNEYDEDIILKENEQDQVNDSAEESTGTPEEVSISDEKVGQQDNNTDADKDIEEEARPREEDTPDTEGNNLNTPQSDELDPTNAMNEEMPNEEVQAEESDSDTPEEKLIEGEEQPTEPEEVIKPNQETKEAQPKESESNNTKQQRETAETGNATLSENRNEDTTEQASMEPKDETPESIDSSPDREEEPSTTERSIEESHIGVTPPPSFNEDMTAHDTTTKDNAEIKESEEQANTHDTNTSEDKEDTATTPEMFGETMSDISPEKKSDEKEVHKTQREEQEVEKTFQKNGSTGILDISLDLGPPADSPYIEPEIVGPQKLAGLVKEQEKEKTSKQQSTTPDVSSSSKKKDDAKKKKDKKKAYTPFLDAPKIKNKDKPSFSLDETDLLIDAQNKKDKTDVATSSEKPIETEIISPPQEYIDKKDDDSTKEDQQPEKSEETNQVATESQASLSNTPSSTTVDLDNLDLSEVTPKQQATPRTPSLKDTSKDSPPIATASKRKYGGKKTLKKSSDDVGLNKRMIIKIIGAFVVLVLVFVVVFRLMFSSTPSSPPPTENMGTGTQPDTYIPPDNTGGAEPPDTPSEQNPSEPEPTPVPEQPDLSGTFTLTELEKKLEAQELEARRALNRAKLLGNRDAIKFSTAALLKATNTLEKIDDDPNVTASEIEQDAERIDLYIQQAIQIIE